MEKETRLLTAWCHSVAQQEAAVQQRWIKLLGDDVQRGLVDPCGDSTVFPPPSVAVYCLLLEKKPAERQVGFALAPVASSTDQCLTAA